MIMVVMLPQMQLRVSAKNKEKRASSVTTIRTMLERLGFSSAEVTYLRGTCGINSLDEIAYLGGIDDVDTTIKGIMNPGRIVMTGMGPSEVPSRNNGIPISIRAVANLKLCV
jgi:hypothetical protein